MSDDSGTADILALRQTPDAIELRHLRAFIAVAEELNFGRAAGRLYLSQPALSRQIRALERLVGCDLLRRSTHRVELTLAGEALLDRARALLADLDAALATTRSVGGELIGRVNRLWAPLIEEVLEGAGELGAMRAAYERMLAQAVIPDELAVLPLTAGGVPALQVSADASAVPSVLHLHGGGLVLGSAYGYRALAGAVADSVGSGVLVPDYRLAPEHPFPAALDDARNAYLWLLDQGVPPSDLIVSGDSGGGGLVVSLMLQLRELGIPLPAGVALLCPGLDLAGLLDGSSPLLASGNGETLAKVAGWYVGDHRVDDPLISPLQADLRGLPPILIQAGTGDPIAHDAGLLAARAEEYGVEVTMELYPVDTHIFQLFWSFLPEARQALAKVGEFTARVRGDEARRTAGS
ncbi:alpha/beta hydrolase fold domain-containing protein [Kribbella voronezhensis]|nr:alpha/beta hydrolase fold domain-containing protein [Kribbella voronezhensis]